MGLERYEFTAGGDFLRYEFDSNSRPKGKIRKVVRFSPQNANGSTYFNLGFGDVNEQTGKVDDLSVPDNQDREKVLTTVAATVVTFLERFPDMMV